MARLNRRNIAQALHLIRTYRNWLALLRADLGGPKVTEMHLRRGPSFTAPDSHIRNIVREIYEQQIYGPPASGVVLDVGANVGVFSVFSAPTATTVHAFEPFPGNVDHMRTNIEHAGATNIVVHSFALSDHDLGAELFLAERSGGHLLFDHNNAGDLATSVKVETRTLASVLDNDIPGPIELIKMDCEGSEGAIMSTLTAEHFGRIRRWAIEYHDNVSSIDHHGLIALLERHGYTVASVSKSRPMFGLITAAL